MKAVFTPHFVERFFDDDPAQARSIPQGSFQVVTEPSGQRRFWFICPGKCKGPSAIALLPQVDPAAAGSNQWWSFNDDMQAPTLSPSINHVDCWHGWLKQGEFVPC